MILDIPTPVVVAQADAEFDGSLLARQRPARRGDPWRALVQNYRWVGVPGSSSTTGSARVRCG
ncbi:MAG TPA: hypothetical protein VIM19_10015, partial [Actinomycetes bacterium]